MLPQGNNIIPGGKLQQGLGYPKTDDDDRNFFKNFYYDNDAFDQAKGKSKKQSKFPQSQQLRAWSAHLTCFPNDVFESKEISIPKCNGAKVLRY